MTAPTPGPRRFSLRHPAAPCALAAEDERGRDRMAAREGRAATRTPVWGAGWGREPLIMSAKPLHKSCQRRRTLELEATFLARSQPPPTPLGVQRSMDKPARRADPTAASVK